MIRLNANLCEPMKNSELIRKLFSDVNLRELKFKRESTRILNNWRVIFIILFIFLFSIFNFVFAHSEDAELNTEIQKGRELFEKLQRGQISCQDLTNKDFHSIGEYAMEQMVSGSDHILMNQMMKKMHGKEAEELMHINMGKRYSGCSEGKALTTTGSMMGPMMNMPMMGYWWWNFSNWKGWNFLAPIFGILGFLWMIIILAIPILVLILLILGILYLSKKLKSKIKED